MLNPLILILRNLNIKSSEKLLIRKVKYGYKICTTNQSQKMRLRFVKLLYKIFYFKNIYLGKFNKK